MPEVPSPVEAKITSEKGPERLDSLLAQYGLKKRFGLTRELDAELEQLDESQLSGLHGLLVRERLRKIKDINVDTTEQFGGISVEVGRICPKSTLLLADGRCIQKDEPHLVSNIHLTPFGATRRKEEYVNATMLLGALDFVKLTSNLAQRERSDRPGILVGVASPDVARIARKVGFGKVESFIYYSDPTGPGMMVVRDGKQVRKGGHLLGKLLGTTAIIGADADNLVDGLPDLRRNAERVKRIMQERYELDEKRARITAIKTLLREI